MAKFTKKMQANTLRLITLNRVQLESFKVDGELQPDATLTYVANVIDDLAFFKSISLRQSNTVKALPSDKVLLTCANVSPDGSQTSTAEIVLNLLGVSSYEFLNCL